MINNWPPPFISDSVGGKSNVYSARARLVVLARDGAGRCPVTSFYLNIFLRDSYEEQEICDSLFAVLILGFWHTKENQVIPPTPVL